MYTFFSQNVNLLLGLLAGAILGTSGLALLLPHRHGDLKPMQSYVTGGVLALIALVLLATQLVGPEVPVNRVFFSIFALLAAFGGTLMITSRDPINSALWFAVVVLCSSGLFLLAGAQFLAAGTVIVYAGAIIVTFLFVLMLAQSHGRAAYDRMARAPLLSSLSSVVMLTAVAACILLGRSGDAPDPLGLGIERRITPAIDHLRVQNTPPGEDLALVINKAIPRTALLPTPPVRGETTDPRRATPHVGGLGATLFVDHMVTVEVIGVILFVALIGAVSYASTKLGKPIAPKSS